MSKTRTETKSYVARHKGLIVDRISSRKPLPYAVLSQLSEAEARKAYYREDTERDLMKAYRVSQEIAATTDGDEAAESAKQTVAAGPEALRAERRKNRRESFGATKANGDYLLKVTWAKDHAEAERRAERLRNMAFSDLVKIVPTEIEDAIDTPEALQSELARIAGQTKDQVMSVVARYAIARGLSGPHTLRKALVSFIELLK